MRLYDESITSFYDELKELPVRRLDVTQDAVSWNDTGDKNIILRSDMAYELGGGTLPALSSLSITDSKELVPEDEILLYGPDLPDIKEDTAYARLTFVRVKEESLGDGNQLYNAIRKIEYVRYHVNPDGFMIRISASNDREPARVGTEALENGLDFTKVGKVFLDAYHKNPNIEAVKLVFVTLPDYPYKELETRIKRNEQITAAIDHIMKNVIMDCNACNLKQICDEVEGMKELHFGAAQEEVSK